MKKIFAMILGCMLMTMACNAEEFEGWNGIDHVKVEQKVDVNSSTVYVYGYATAEMKNKNKVDKQQAAFDELGNTVAQMLRDAFPKAEVKVIADPKEAPAGAVLVEACLKEISWGSGAARQLVGYGLGNIHARYFVKVTNGSGLVCELENHRFHDTTFASAKGPAVIKVYNKAIAKDLIEVLKK